MEKIREAKESLQDMLDRGEGGTVDMIFIDADKLNYVSAFGRKSH